MKEGEFASTDAALLLQCAHKMRKVIERARQIADMRVPNQFSLLAVADSEEIKRLIHAVVGIEEIG